MELTLTEADLKALGTDYPEEEVSRSEAAEYPIVQRGSVRLVEGMYRTQREQRDFLDDGLRLQLPGQKNYHRAAGVLAVFRRFLTSLK